MLDRVKVLQALTHIQHKIAPYFSDELQEAQRLIAAVQENPAIAAACRHQNLSRWQGSFAAQFDCPLPTDPYRVMAVDGSQIYPDRHQGTTCGLINIGSIDIQYTRPAAKVTLHTEPHILVPDGSSYDTQTINCLRHAYELEYAATYTFAEATLPSCIFLDGSLIFWHLENKEEPVKQQFLNRYITSLETLYTHKVPTAWYISRPHTKELVQILRYVQEMSDHTSCIALDHIIDMHIAKQMLEPGQRTTLFEHISLRTYYYPDHLRPYFWYQHVGTEIARVEIPAWIAHTADAVTQISMVVQDQALKGLGYPISLAEAHEQAVIKQADREFFYQFFHKINTGNPSLSQKNVRKNKMGI